MLLQFRKKNYKKLGESPDPTRIVVRRLTPSSVMAMLNTVQRTLDALTNQPNIGRTTKLDVRTRINLDVAMFATKLVNTITQLMHQIDSIEGEQMHFEAQRWLGLTGLSKSLSDSVAASKVLLERYILQSKHYETFFDVHYFYVRLLSARAHPMNAIDLFFITQQYVVEKLKTQLLSPENAQVLLTLLDLSLDPVLRFYHSIGTDNMGGFQWDQFYRMIDGFVDIEASRSVVENNLCDAVLALNLKLSRGMTSVLRVGDDKLLAPRQTI